jgi:hypothetical protein
MSMDMIEPTIPGEPAWSDLVQRLDATLQPIESGFLDCGQDLAGAAASMRGIARAFAGLSDLLHSENFGQAVDGLATVTGALASVAVGGTSQDALTRLDDLVQRVAAPLDRLRKTVGEVEILAVNARIEAAHVVAADTDFSVFTTEMTRLAQLAKATLDKLAAERDALTGLSESAGRLQVDFDRQQSEMLADIKERLGAGMRLVEDRRRAAVQSAQQVEKQSKATEGQLNDVIQALQVGDMARQRVEHVARALETLAGDDNRSHRGRICHLQAVQLKDTERELRQAVGRISDRMADLARGGDTIRATGRDAFASSAGRDAASADGGNSFVHDLARDLRRAADILDGARDADRALHERLEPLSQSVAAMTTHLEAVHNVEAEMRVMGLNATLKCSRLGYQGRALGVIAQALRAHAGRTAEDAGQIMTGLGEIQHVAGDLRSEQARDSDGVVGSLVTAIQTFDEGAHLLASALSALDAEARNSESLLRQAASRLLSDDSVLTTLAECGAILDDAARALGDGAGGDDSSGDFLRGTYTMASQREAHARILGGGGTGGDTGTAVADADDIGDLLF